LILKKILPFFVCLTISIHSLLPSILSGTLIKTADGHITAESIACGDTVIAYDSELLSIASITHIKKTTTDIVVAITTEKGLFYAAPDQLFYDPITNQWILAKSISIQTVFLNAQLDHCPCINVEIISIKPIDVYHISTTSPHNFFITEQELLTHNAIPLFIGIAWLFGEGLQFAGMTLGTALLGSYIGVQLYNAQKQKEKECELEFHVVSCGSPCPDPDDDKERKFNTITKSEFFKNVKNDYEHYKNGIYKRKKGAKGIDNAEYLEWDHLHGDVEAYGGNRWHIGSIDPKSLKFYKPAVAARRLPK
jgi:hypothetical protein